MTKDNVINLKRPIESASDVLSSLLRQGAQQLLIQAIEEEITLFLSRNNSSPQPTQAAQVVRNGYLPERNIQTGIGDICVKIPRVRDRSRSGIQFTSNLIPKYMRRTKNIEELLPVLYLKGISTGDFEEALMSLVGDKAKGMSATTICRLKQVWQDDYDVWRQRDLSKKRYIYIWVDGIYLQARLESKQCLFVIIGADEFGNKELLSVTDGFRESEESWTEALLDLKSRGLKDGANLAVGDGALGFWKALHKVFPKTKQQRCWVHKTANILNKLPDTLQEKAKSQLHDIWMNETKAGAMKSFDLFLEIYAAKYPKATHCLKKDQEELLEFYNFPAEHWIHIRTTNPIESTFATVRLGTAKTRGSLSRKTAFTMVFKLLESASKNWRRLRGQHRVAEIIQGINFVDGIAHQDLQERCAA
jgi:transposase-like protein